MWDAAIFDENDNDENIANLLRRKIQSLDKHVILALKIASILGSPFSLSSLRLIANSKGVEDALASGLIAQYQGCDVCCFVHDQVQHAAKSLLPNNSKPIFLCAARKLSKLLSTDDLEKNFCVIVKLNKHFT